jgi:hypothetical protein
MSLTLTAFVFTASLVARLPLVVRTYDAAGVPPPAFDQARVSATVVLAAAGIQPIWRPCHATVCTAPPKPHEIEIRIVKATRLSSSGSLGFATVDVVQHEGTLATIYFDRITALAAQIGADAGELLGRAVAHEIGHLVLGTTTHSAVGLMRATWTGDEIRRRVPLDWLFSTQEGEEMQRRLNDGRLVQ